MMDDNTNLDALHELSAQIHPDDLKRLAKADKPHGRYGAVDLNQRSAPTPGASRLIDSAELNALHQLVNEDEPSAPDAAWQHEIARAAQRRDAARRRLMQQKQKNLGKAFDLTLMLQILFLMTAIVFESWYRHLRSAKRAFDRQPVAVRGGILIASASLILIIVAVLFGMEIKAYQDAHSGPFLAEALDDHYGLSERTGIPTTENAYDLMPQSLDRFRTSDTVLSASTPTSLVNSCLLGIEPPQGYNWCQRTVGQTSSAAGRYFDVKRGFVDLAVTRFPGVQYADQTMSELLAYARKTGHVGNFAIAGVADTDYFYSYNRGWVTFTWSRGPWVFSMAATSYDDLESAIAAFGY